MYSNDSSVFDLVASLLQQGYHLNPDDATVPTLEKIITSGQGVIGCAVSIDDDAHLISVEPSERVAAA